MHCPAEMTAELRTAVARQLADAKHDIDNVIVVDYTGQEIVEHARDKWSNDLVDTGEGNDCWAFGSLFL
jgi:acrylyl-CoA reductase (NADPH)/3-hydroxypropionyl-CoA dehydratase/3-hydroxypropionyl-CoA synthetase